MATLKDLARADELRADKISASSFVKLENLIEQTKTRWDKHGSHLLEASIIFTANTFPKTNMIYRAPPPNYNFRTRQIIASRGVRPATTVSDLVPQIDKAIAMLYMIMDQKTGLVVGINDHYGKEIANVNNPNGAEYNELYLPAKDDLILILRGGGVMEELDAQTAQPVNTKSSSRGANQPTTQSAFNENIGMRVAILKTDLLDSEGRFLERLVQVEEYDGATLTRRHLFVHIEALDWKDNGIMSIKDTTLLMMRFVDLFSKTLSWKGDVVYKDIILHRAIIHCAAGIGRTGVLAALAISFMPVISGRWTIYDIIAGMRIARGYAMVYDWTQWCLVYYMTLFETPEELIKLLTVRNNRAISNIRFRAARVLQRLLKPYFVKANSPKVLLVAMTGLVEKESTGVVVDKNGIYIKSVFLNSRGARAVTLNSVNTIPPLQPQAPPALFAKMKEPTPPNPTLDFGPGMLQIN